MIGVPKPSQQVKPPKAPKPRKRVKRVNPERQARTHDKPYREFIRTQPCIIADRQAPDSWCGPVGERRDIEPAHVRTYGSVRQDRGELVSLCPVHHDEQEGDNDGFERTYGMNLPLIAARMLVRFIEQGNR